MQLRSPEWTDPPREPEAPTPPVQIWRLRLSDLDGDPLDTLRPLTAASEHRRACRYQFAADRHRHLAGRAVVRLVLARRYGCAPRDLSLTDGPHGKPRLKASPSDAAPLHFNVAHTKDVVVAAFSQAHPVGIDVESTRREADTEALAQRVLTAAEREWWRARPKAHRHAAFLHLWTCKEAFLKATGHGLQRAPRTIECTFDGDTVGALTDAEGHTPTDPEASAARWVVRSFSASADGAGAVVRKQAFPSSLAWTDAARLVNRHARS
jgi:4'-phosphopantetheinyl transferase